MRSATQALTVLAELAPGEARARLDHRLAEIAAAPATNRWFRPHELPDTHFMRFAIIDDPRGELPPLLAWECNHDGYAADYLAEVARTARSIETVFECCAHYPTGCIADVARWVDWMMARAYPAGAFYTAYRGVPHAMIVNDRRVHAALRRVLDHQDRAALHGLSRHELQRRICAEVADRHPELELSTDDEEEMRWMTGKLGAIGLVLLLLPFAILFGLPWYLALRHKESTDIASAYARPVDVDPAVKAIEDRGLQNQLTHVVDIKPGELRLATLWLVLKAIDLIARVYSVRGDLGGITSIHFARWVILRDRRSRRVRRGAAARHRLLFFSNYDGSWESYLGEFIDRAAYGLTAVWSNTRGFPATRYLVGDGARDEAAFKQWTREHQVATQVWWTGAPSSTVRNVRDDIWIRRRLDRGLTDDEVTSWLRRL
ncbi:MAG TPA: hypothetical protein VH165_30260 [Kofleriaceae bacterium]|jgi:hypothetical protein|nr:hypothetical protein [Kofleriaceae bacterium]